jgi:hypothetical protein
VFIRIFRRNFSVRIMKRLFSRCSGLQAQWCNRIDTNDLTINGKQSYCC